MTQIEYYKAIDQLNKWAHHYYCLDDPIATDKEYDELYQQVVNYEKEHNYVNNNSPTLRIGDKIKKGFTKHSRKYKMFSLDDVFNLEDLEKWLKKMFSYGMNWQKDIIGEYSSALLPTFCCSPKFDGCSIELDYKNELLHIASTRGDGIIGEDVTENAKTINSIPLSISLDKLNSISIRGEIVISKENFKKLNKDNKFSNPRNLASGSLRQNDPKITKSRKLTFIPWSIGGIEEFQKYRIQSQHLFIKNCNELYSALKVVYDSAYFYPAFKWFKNCKSVEEVLEYCKDVQKNRDKYPFELDGVVITLNDVSQWKEVGYTKKCAKYSIAYKFPPKEVTTKIKDIEHRVADTGTITPVAILDPVVIDGKTISKVTLHNYPRIQEEDIKIGDSVVLILSGDVIPKITKVFKDRRDGSEKEISIPTKCPSCNSTEIEYQGKYLKCINHKEL